MKIDVHQHIWSEPLVEALAARREVPFVRQENGLSVLYLAGERPYVIDLAGESGSRRETLVERDGLDRAFVCLSSPLGIEGLGREEALDLIDAYHEGALSLEEPFGVWAALALDRADPADLDCALERGCVGLALPAGALAVGRGGGGRSALCSRAWSFTARRCSVHPAPACSRVRSLRSRALAFGAAFGGPRSPATSPPCRPPGCLLGGGTAQPSRLRVIFTMLAGLAPLHAERLATRGGPHANAPDPLVFYDISSYGPVAVRSMAALVGADQLLYGSDRPVVDPRELGMHEALDWDHTPRPPAARSASPG